MSGVGRNDPCPCGSGRKYKLCCGRFGQRVNPSSAPPQHTSELVALLRSGRFAELERSARSLTAQRPDNGIAWKALTVALQMQGKDALAAARRAAQLLPADAEVHYNLGTALLDAGSPVDAIGSLERALSLAPDSEPTQVALGGALQSAGRVAEAVARYRRVLAVNPGYAEVHSNLGHAFRQLGRLQESIDSCRRALAIKPELAEAHSNLGNALAALGERDEAAASYRRALILRPTLLEAHVNLSNLLMSQGRFAEAADAFRQALQLEPRLAQVHSSLGYVLRQIGKPQEALESCRRALQLAPNLAAAHVNLGNALADLGQREEAEASYRRALTLEPGRAELHNNLSRVLLEMGRVDESIAASHRALQIDPNLPEAHENLAAALLNVNFEEAVGHYRQALRFRPDDAELNNSLGVALRLLGRTAEAETFCRRALELSPAYAPAIAALAEVNADRGDFAAAESLFKQALALDGDLSDVWVGLSRLRRFTREDAAWLDQAERVAGRSRKPREVIALRYAIGKYFDDIGEYQQAFGNYRRANELAKRHSRPYDPEQVTRQVDGLVASYPRVVPVDGATVTTRAVLIVGMPRSGTSLAEQILASHPSVFGAGELNFWHSGSLTLRAGGAGAGAEDRIRQLGADYERLLAGMSSGAPRVVDKMPTNFLELGLVLRALPGTKVIHMRRDPVDTCLSNYFQDFRATIAYANDLDDLVHFYRAYERLMQHWRSALPTGTLLDVPYEALVDEQETWTRRMLEFIDLPWDPACLDFHQTQRSVVTASKWQVRQKINRSSVARWRHYQRYIAPLLELLPPAQGPTDAVSG